MSSTRSSPSLMSIRMENPATKFYHAINNAIKILFNRKNFSTKFTEQLSGKPEEERAEILFELYELLKKKKNELEEGIIEVFRKKGLEELFKEVLTLKTMRSALKSFAEDDLVGMIPEPFAFKKLHEMEAKNTRMDVYETAFKQNQMIIDSDSDDKDQDQDMLNQGMSVDEPQYSKRPKVNIDFEKLMSQIENQKEEEGDEMNNAERQDEVEIDAPEALLKSQFIVNQKIKYVNEQIEKELKELKTVMVKNGLSIEDLGESTNLPEMMAILKDEDEDMERQSPPKKDMTFSLF